MSVKETLLSVGRGEEAGLTGWRHSNLWIFGTMLFSALLSLTAAFVLSVEAWIIAGDPNAVFGCDVNAILSCGTVARSWQASAFGFPNAFLGLMFEPVVITLAVAGLSGIRFRRWFMVATQLLYLFAISFALWLFYQSSFEIHALCPWCLLITFGTTLVFFTLLHYNVREDNLHLPPALQVKAERFVAGGGDALLAMGILAVVTVIIIVNYGAFLLPF